MNMELYNQVRDMMRSGKSMEDVQHELYAMAETAAKEVQPQTPIADYFANRDNIDRFKAAVVDPRDGGINLYPLQMLVCAYFIQDGFKADRVHDNVDEYIDSIKKWFNQQADVLKYLDDIADMAENGSSDEEMIGAIFGKAAALLKSALSED